MKNIYNFMWINTKNFQKIKYQMWIGVKPSEAKTDKTSQLENAIEDANEFHFGELGLDVNLVTSSRTSHGETPRSNKIERCKVCKILSSLRRCDQFTRPKAPLDSTTICPITRYPNKHIETGKRKT
jgi:hypothetical protein